MLDKVKQRVADRESPIILRLEHLEIDAPLVKAIEEGASIKLIYDLGILVIVQVNFLGNSLQVNQGR